MPEPRERFAPNREDVAAKVIDGELIIIRLSDGTYYSMDNVGARVWELIERQLDVPAVAAAIAGRYRVPVEQVARDVGTLVQELLAEGLVVDAGSDAAPAASADVEPEGDPPAYESPRLAVYRDMGNLLALDPPTPGIDDLMFGDGKPK
jgi:hypothetical protein